MDSPRRARHTRRRRRSTRHVKYPPLPPRSGAPALGADSGLGAAHGTPRGPGAHRLRRALPWGALLIVLLSGGTLAAASAHIEAEQSGYSGPAAAQCTPEHLDASAILPGTSATVSPLPGSRDASPQQQISFLGVPARDITDLSVSGTFSGGHSGRLQPYSQGDGASFLPDQPFDPGETVTVHGDIRSGSATRPFGFHFAIAYADPIPFVGPGSKTELAQGSYQSYHSAPDLHPPDVYVTYESPEAGAGDIFTAPYAGPGDTGPMIIEPDGQLVWMDPLPQHVFATNLRLQQLDGRQVLTWWQGYIPQNGFGMGEEIVDDSSYRTIMHVHPGNGYRADLHEFRIGANDTAVLTVFNPIHCDLTSIGGPRDGDVTNTLFQELDLRTGLVRREWTGLDHVPLSATQVSPEGASAEWPLDYLHINSIDPRSDGTTLLSARNTWQLYVINDRTGQIEATVGGKHPTVAMESGTETAYQHDAETLPDGDISVFDNGGSPFVHQQTRGLVIELNLHSHTDRKVAELVHPRPLQAASQGDVQLLPDGHWFLGWGGEPYFTEFNANGEMIYDAHMPLEEVSSDVKGEHLNSYRDYKFEWQARPYYPPSIAAEASDGGLTVYASWNGATEVSTWQVLGGDSPASLKPLASSPRSGFETAIHVPSSSYVAVQALDSAGSVIGRSQTIKG